MKNFLSKSAVKPAPKTEEKKIVFTLEQIDELKYIIEDSGVNDAIDYIDEIVEPQVGEGYTSGRVIS